LDDDDADHVRMQTFAKEFHYYQEESAEEAYLKLIRSSRIPLSRRQSLQQDYEIFKANNAKHYWESVQMKSGLRSVARRAAVVTAEAGLQEAQAEYSIFSEASSTTRTRQPDKPESPVESNPTDDSVQNENSTSSSTPSANPFEQFEVDYSGTPPI